MLIDMSTFHQKRYPSRGMKGEGKERAGQGNEPMISQGKHPTHGNKLRGRKNSGGDKSRQKGTGKGRMQSYQ